MSNTNNYYELYKASKEKVRQEELLQTSIKYSIIREIQESGLQFLADIIGYYSNKETRGVWNSVFFNNMNEYFFENVEWTFKEIVLVGREVYAYRVVFEMEEEEYSITIPNPKQITYENIVHADFGRFSLEKHVGLAVWEELCSSYDKKDILDAIKSMSIWG